MGDLTTLSEETLAQQLRNLQVEVDRRAKERREKAVEASNKRLEDFRGILNQELVDLLSPGHDRTSCSDDSPSNGFEADGDGIRYRCIRCALFEIMLEGWAPSGGRVFDLRLDLSFKYP